ncbi:retroviral-like aspartic protease family protein [Pseudokordiimonas caeni]|uniref:retroviral-like aspartic protease family protein n=1 Tax=Pseudokordiimonas caeni TaxID=2997908 RepID=UPI0028124A88|nr:retroviral-like aspartic protease family protein [Pseudokordiimonas caeni]
MLNAVTKSDGRGRRWRSLLCFLGLAAVSLPAFADPSAPALHRDRYGRFNVETTVNGREGFLFLVDTGASRTTVYRSLAADLGLRSLPRTQTIVTATGTQESLVYPIASITAFGRTLRPGQMAALPERASGRLAGVLGIDILRGAMIEFDVKKPAGRLLPPGSAPGDGSWVRVDGRPVGYGSLALEVVVDGVTIPAFIDTGAGLSVFNPPAGKALGKGSLVLNKNGKPRRTPGISAGAGNISGLLRDVGELRIGDHKVAAVRVTEADLPVFDLFGASEFPAMILGMDILSKQDFAVDLGHWRLWIRPPAQKQD